METVVDQADQTVADHLASCPKCKTVDQAKNHLIETYVGFGGPPSSSPMGSSYRVQRVGNQWCVLDQGLVVQCFFDEASATNKLRDLNRDRSYAFSKHDAWVNPATWGQAMQHVVASWEQDHPFGWATVTLHPSGRQYIAAVAETTEQKIRGMIGRRFEDFGAMLFAYQQDETVEFHMRGVLEQLYIAWFDGDGKLVDRIGMFTSDPWTYKAARPFRYALELPAAAGGDQFPDGSPVLPDGTWGWLDGQVIEAVPFERVSAHIGRDVSGFFWFDRDKRTPSYSTIDEIPVTE